MNRDKIKSRVDILTSGKPDTLKRQYHMNI